MEHSPATAGPRAAFAVALLILLVAVAVLIIAQDYTGGSGVYPRFVGWIFVGLCLVELFIQVKALVSSPAVAATGESKTLVVKEMTGFLWLAYFLVVLLLTGFIIGVPIYMFTFLRWSAGRSYLKCTLMALGATLFIYILFMVILEYRLYPGLLFGG
jgi:hypothetical protein